MAVAYPQILSLKNEGERYGWNAEDTLHYALGVGMESDPMNADELPFIYERDLKPVSTQASVVALGANLGVQGINDMRVVDGEHKVEFHKPMTLQGDVVASTRIVGAWDNGVGKRAVIVSETAMRDAASGELALMVTMTHFAR